MRRILLFFGVCVLLLAVETRAAKHSKKSFIDFGDLWGTDDAVPATGNNADFTLDTEGSGLDVKVDSTHADDEDFDVEASGDDLDVDVTTETPASVTDEYYYDHKGTSDDEDDLEGSGSGDGIDEETIVPVTDSPVMAEKTTPRKQLTPCMSLLTTAKQAMSAFKPKCDSDGDFEKLQCMRDSTNEEYCWCVDPMGIEISGTRMKYPKADPAICSEGKNLSKCVFHLVRNSNGLLGTYKPKCTLEGEYEPIQCMGSQCFCVDAAGKKIEGTATNRAEIPVCPSATTKKPVEIKPLPEETEPGYTVDEGSNEEIPNVIVNIRPDSEESETDIEELEEETNAIGGESYATMRRKDAVLEQPGLLAAIIGGAVVGLLCMVLLVMFIVYRMRKKDEGSYPLDDQKYQNYSYAKAPDKEFYA